MPNDTIEVGLLEWHMSYSINCIMTNKSISAGGVRDQYRFMGDMLYLYLIATYSDQAENINAKYIKVSAPLRTTGFGSPIAIVTPWAENSSLSGYLKHHGEMGTCLRRFHILRDVAYGLQYSVHINNIIHSDLTEALLMPHELQHSKETCNEWLLNCLVITVFTNLYVLDVYRGQNISVPLLPYWDDSHYIANSDTFSCEDIIIELLILISLHLVFLVLLLIIIIIIILVLVPLTIVLIYIFSKKTPSKTE
ncbi:hypothetical protein DFH29DRAFT_880989 [Suillus ampliporus]|nr:hypothetical protein DFH29DRAFT_880989 [Suillus ampliporus]